MPRVAQAHPSSCLAAAMRRAAAPIRGILAALIGIGVLAAISHAQPAQKSQQPVAQDQGPQSQYVGDEMCASCHDEVAKKFTSNPHAALAQEHKQQGVSCESCHGPGRAHVDGGGDVKKIFNPAKAKSEAVDKICLGCHQNQHADFARSAHGAASVSCLGCHTVHAAKNVPHLLQAAQPALCYKCHSDVKPQFAMPFHHRVGEGLMTCTDCHEPHGTIQQRAMRSSAQQDLICTSCHTETAGPFVYEHPAVRTQGCMACHNPHGSPNPRLLNRANVNTICLQCHSPSANFTTPGTPTFHNQAAQYQACTICHVSIHGSNTSDIFFNSTE